MAEQTDIQKPQSGPLATIKTYLSDQSVKKRLEEMLGKRADAFANSVINLVRNSRQLQACTPDSVMSSAMIAASMNLPIDPALGQSAIVPYKSGQGPSSAQFQLMYRGVIQLCIRSGQYKHINCTEVYADEIDYYNPITGEVVFKNPSSFKLRYQPDRDKHVIGHYIYWKLLSGFEHSGYISCAEALAHAKRYSKAYQYDNSQGKKTSAWSTHPVEMGNKTILIRELKRYGVMSIELQDAFVQDRETFEDAQAESRELIDADMGSQAVDPDARPANKEAGRRSRKRKSVAATEIPPPDPETPEFMGDDADGGTDTKNGELRFLCKGKCGQPFSEPAQTKGPSGMIYICPNCRSLAYEAIEEAGAAVA